MKFIFSKHALTQMKLRHISPSMVRRILKKPDQVIPQKGKKVYQSIVRADGTPKALNPYLC